MLCSKCNNSAEGLTEAALCPDCYLEAAERTTTAAELNPEQEASVRSFLECWNLSMPYHDIGSALNCGECNALHAMLLAFGALDAARALIEAHSADDDQGDDPDHLRIKATRITSG